VKYAWVASYKTVLPIAISFDVLGLSTSGYRIHNIATSAAKREPPSPPASASATTPCWFTFAPSTPKTKVGTAGPACSESFKPEVSAWAKRACSAP
jgi:hypothetical protein